MLKKLRIKFVIVIMSVVTVLFLIIFGLLTQMTKKNIERDNIQMMRTLALSPQPPVSFGKSDNAHDNIRLPFFTVTISDDGILTAYGIEDFAFDDEKIQNLMNRVGESKNPVGIISEHDLRFMKADNGSTVVFADISSENAMIGGLIKSSVLIGLIGYTIIFIISILLARWVTKPVEKTWNEQKQFIADASHELKTPLTVIMTNAEMLADGSYSESDRENFQKNILSMSKRMRGLVESLLELARMDNRTTVIEKKQTNMSRLLSDCILLFEPLFFEKGIDLSVETEDDVQIYGNKEKLKQVLTVLLDNALKYYDPAYGVNVKLKIQQNQCVFSISGKGETLSKEDCKKIFKRFYRVDKARSDDQSYGLGLSIAESIVNEHNGRIWAESDDGYNKFFVSLPCMH